MGIPWGKPKKNLENQGPRFSVSKIKFDTTPVTYPEMENSLLLMKGVENGFYVSEEIMNKLYLRQKEEMDGVCLITPQILKDVRAICKVINEDYCFTNHKR